ISSPASQLRADPFRKDFEDRSGIIVEPPDLSQIDQEVILMAGPLENGIDLPQSFKTRPARRMIGQGGRSFKDLFSSEKVQQRKNLSLRLQADLLLFEELFQLGGFFFSDRVKHFFKKFGRRLERPEDAAGEGH